MDATEEEMEAISGTGFAVIETSDLNNVEMPDESDFQISDRHLLTQRALLLNFRVFEAILKAGNPTHVALEATKHLFDATPPKAWERALDWCDPEMGSVFGDSDWAPPSPPTEETIQIVTRARSAFTNCARTVAIVNHWIKMGVGLGMEFDAITSAAATQLDMSFIIAPSSCECDVCSNLRLEWTKNNE
jgi:hypothetical protein